jgi:hypothetical protein
MMKKVLMCTLLGIIFISLIVLAVNLEFTIDIPDKIFYSNETIPVNASIINREISFSARDVTLNISIGKRAFFYELGDIKASDSILRELTLPEFPPGDYVIKGILTYTGLFDETTHLETYNSFHVGFPEMGRLPRNIVIKEFILPEKIVAGETHAISVVIANEGDIDGNIIITINSLDSLISKSIQLKPGETETVSMDMNFYNPGLSLAEARVYALVNDIKYLLTYDATNIFIKESQFAKLEFDKLELVDEFDNKINSEDTVKLKIYLKNIGTWSASNVTAILTSSEPKLKILQSDANYSSISAKQSVSEIFEIKTEGLLNTTKLNLSVSFLDFEERNENLEISIEIDSDSKVCLNSEHCKSDELCENGKCIDISCECGEVINRQCELYSCCGDFDCEEGYSCSSENHICEPSQEIKADVLIITSSELKTDEEYNKVLKEYRKTILEEGLTSFYIIVDSQKVKDLFNVKPANVSDWKSVKNVLDKIIYKLEPDYILIFGGVNTIPQPLAKTNAKIPTVPPSDDIYSDITLDGIPDLSLGRIPIDNTKSITDYINMLTELHGKGNFNNKLILGDACGGSDCFLYKDIQYVSKFIFGTECEQTNNCLKSPPYCSAKGSHPIYPFTCKKKSEMLSSIKDSDFIFFGAHGDGTSFVSIEDETGLVADLILSGNQIYNDMDFSKKFIMTFACFGGSIDISHTCLSTGICMEPELKIYESTALASIHKKAPVYIGNTRYGYGGTTSAKLLMKILDEMKNGETVGKAVLKMKQEKLSESWSDWYNAVIYEIQLYGDPTLKFTGV